MKLIHFLGFSTFTLVPVVTSFPRRSLSGLSIEERDLIISRLQVHQGDPFSGPLNDTSTKLVNDKDHPWGPLQPGDIRGPCPGLNTLASHGVRPAQNSISLTDDPLLLLVASTQWYCYSCPNHWRGPTRYLVMAFDAMNYWLATY